MPGCSHVILGHSERRHGHGESDALVRAKIAAAWRAGLIAIVCVGETRESARRAGRSRSSPRQLAGSLPDGADADALVVAYEPVWAIGTGLTPTLDDIAAMHAAIRAASRPARASSTAARSTRRNAARSSASPRSTARWSAAPASKAEDFWAIARSCR